MVCDDTIKTLNIVINKQYINRLIIYNNNTIKDIVLRVLTILNQKLTGNYSVTLNIQSYQIHSSDIADNWYKSIGDIGVLGYFNNNSNNNINDRDDIWNSIDQATIEIIPMTLKNQSKINHSYIKLNNGQLVGFALIN